MSSPRYLVIGLGRFGTALAHALAEAGAEVIAVDSDMANVEAVKSRVAYAIQLDATDPEALRSVDCVSCKSVIVAIGENFEATVLCVAALKEVGVGHVVARALTTRQARILQAVGASEVVEIEVEMGMALGKRLVDGNPSGGSVVAAVPKR
ncbi:MAG TPA: TrkA family potassium uptake protein [Nannocystaceae bacterium]|nr:TrkA family potassium uptake protein [Nannocystaceae bacterium]